MYRFEYRGITYEVDESAYEKSKAVFGVTGGVALVNLVWSETYPPKIREISEPAIYSCMISMEQVAQMNDAVIAREVSG